MSWNSKITKLLLISGTIFIIVVASILGLGASKLINTSKFSFKTIFVVLICLMTSLIIYFRRPGWIIKLILFLKAKFILFKNYSLVQVNRFKTASNRDRWLMIKKPLFAIMALFLILKFGPLFLPPKIVTSFPGDQSTEAPLDSKIEIIFDKGVIKYLAEKSFSISPNIPGKLSWESDQKIIFTPTNKLNRASSYTVSLKGLVLSKFLIPLFRNKNITFETLGNPKVVLVSPKDEALEDLSPITAIFDRPMIPLTTATNSGVKLPAFSITPPLAGEGRWLGTTAYQFRPSVALKKATTYKVTIPPGIRSQDEGVLKDGYSWEFSSGRPRVDAVSPKRDYNFASPTASISATFNQNLDPKSITDKFAVYDKNGNKISGRLVVSGKTVGFYGFQPLPREEQYTATISNGVQSLEGENGMENTYSWSFGVGAKPAAVSSTPANGATEVSEQYNVTVIFKTPMDNDSFKNNVIIDPQPEKPLSTYFSSWNSKHSLSISTALKRSIKYTITLGSGVRDQYGVPINPYTFSFTTAAYKPSVSIFPSNTYFGSFNQQVTPRIVATVTNATTVNYSLYKLSRENFLELYRKHYGYGKNDCSYSDYGCSNWQTYDTSKLEKVRLWNETFEADFNTQVRVITKVSKDTGENIPSGFYFLDVRIPDGAHDNMVMIVTNSTLTVKKSDNQIFAWAVNQSTADVIPGMKTELTDSSGNILSQGVTDNNGVFVNTVDLKNKDQLFVFGEKNGDIVVASTTWNQGLSRYDFGLSSYYDYNEQKDSKVTQNYKIFTTSDRPIYRPGQKVYFKGVIRKDNDGAYENLPSGEKINVFIKDAQNKSISTQSLPISTFGSYFGEFDLSKDASLGLYYLQSEFQGNSYSAQFQVEEYKKPDMSISVNPSKTSYSQGDNAGININASYYFGAPVSDSPVDWTLQTSDYSFRWDKDWRFEFEDPDSYWSRPWWYYSGSSYYSGKVITKGDGKTDSKGNLDILIPIDISKYKASQKMIVEASVNDISNQNVSASQEFTVFKSQLFAGLRPVSYANSSGKEAQVEVVTVDIKGNEVPNIPVAIDFYKRTWETIREKNPDDGIFYYTSKPSDTLVSNTTVTSDSLGRATASFTPSEGGTYKVVGRVTDKNGSQNTSGSFLWVSGSGFSTARENNDRIVLVTDKRDYLVGENLSVFVASPYASESAKTLLTAERGSVLDYKVVDTNESSNNFVMSVSPKFTPNVYLGAVLVRGGNEVKKPAEFKVGYTEVKVTDKKQQIDISISTDKSKYKPKDTLKATIETKDLLGHPISTELAVGLVDKAVWDLSNIELPDIYKVFYQPRNLLVSTSQLLAISIDRINANTNLGAKGGSGGGCFTGDTPILMKDGIYKNIQDIQIGDTVLTRESESSQKLVEARVSKTYKHKNIDQYLIINGFLHVTPVHKMYVNSKWITAGEIQIGDYLLNKNNELVRVFSIEPLQGNFDVYNLEIEKYRTYFAGDIYVHNQKGPGFDTSRRNFPDTAYWNPALKTNAEGKATIEIPLPDNLTTWRLAAIANSDGSAFGSKVSEFVVSQDVLIRPLLPRFLSVGDQAQLGATIVNTSGEDKTFTVSIQTDGLQIKDNAPKEVVIVDGAQTKVLWSTITNPVSSAKVKFMVEGPDKKTQDAVEITLPVKAYSTPEVVATAGQAKDTASETITLPKELDITQGTAKISFSPFLGGDSITALPYLLDYPYFCSEQITSRILPAIFTYRILQSAKIDQIGSINTKDLSRVINDGIQRLNNQQHTDGGWGWWSEDQSDTFVSAYAYSALAEAKVSKFTVADQTIEKAKTFLYSQLSGNKDLSPETRAFILYALGGKSLNLSAYAANLFDTRFELSLEGRAYLAMSMKDMPNMESQANRILNELISLSKKTATTTHWEESNYNYRFMGSNTTATAAILEALIKFDKNNPLIPEVIRYLMSIKKDDHWYSTRDTAAVIKAISFDFLNKSGQKVNENFKLELNGKPLQEGKFTKEDLFKLQEYVIPISGFNIGGDSNLRITKSGQGDLYYNINLKYYLPFTKIKPLEQGMVIIREFVDNNGKTLPKDVVKENTEFWVRLIIVTPAERYFVMIEDVLPAGLESVNESLKNVSTLAVNSPKVKDKGNQYLYFSHKEYHDDKTTLFASFLPAGVYETSYRVRATTPGIYHYPPAQAYQMYVPDVSGHSDGGWLEVK